MKARVKGTNEIVEVKPNGTSKTIHISCSEFISEDGRVFPSIYLDIVNEVDWEQVRIQAAIAMMQAITTDGRREGGTIEDAASVATRYADALIAELQKKQ